MVTLLIDDAVAAQLNQLALEENRSLDAVLRSMLEHYVPLTQSSNWPLEMARLAEADTEIEWNEDASDLSERSRELLDTEFEAHLLRRANNNENSG